MSWLDTTVAADHSFACCLTHDVDRPFKTYQSLFNAVVNQNPSQLVDLLPHRNPYWTFEEILEIETDLDVRSSWYFLDEQSLLADRPFREWVDTSAWRLYAGRYSLDDERIQTLVRKLDDGGWEVGLHGSYESYQNQELLAREKARLESILGHEVEGIRQHYMNLDRPETWERQRALGLEYDTSVGSAESMGFEEGYRPLRPFDDEFVVFPLTIMDTAVPDPAEDWERAWGQCESLLKEARDNEAVMTVLWHPRYFSTDHPGHAELYRALIERAQELGAWVGPVGELYASLDRHTSKTESSKLREP